MAEMLRRMQTGLYATPSAPHRGIAALVVMAPYRLLDEIDRQHVPRETFYACVSCHKALTRGQATFTILYNAAREPFVLVTSCDKAKCFAHVTSVFGMDPDHG